MRLRSLITLAIMTLVIIDTGCHRGGSSVLESRVAGDTITHRSQLLTMVDYGAYVTADVVDPWRSERVVRYVMVRDSSLNADDVPQGVRIYVPLKRSLVYSGVHGGAIDELGAVDRITAVTDGAYFSTPSIVQGLSVGEVIDVGNSMSPSVELIVAHGPEAILASPYQNAGFGAVEALGIPIVECADYMEQEPLGRAEWIKLLGVLYGVESRADSVFEIVCSEYEGLRRSNNGGPKVLVEQMTDGVWYVPGGKSYMANLISDAGGVYPWADNGEAGSLPLDMAAVLDRAVDADVWLIRSYGPLTSKTLLANSPVNAEFRAFKNGNVWVCNTAQSRLFEEFPFHPEQLLREFIAIFSDTTENGSTRYYQRMKP